MTILNPQTMHFELHLILNLSAADLAPLAGLPEVPYDLTECSNCEEPIGRAPGLAVKFIPLAIVLDDTDDSTLLCLRCVAPVCAPAA